METIQQEEGVRTPEYMKKNAIDGALRSILFRARQEEMSITEFIDSVGKKRPVDTVPAAMMAFVQNLSHASSHVYSEALRK